MRRYCLVSRPGSQDRKILPVDRRYAFVGNRVDVGSEWFVISALLPEDTERFDAQKLRSGFIGKDVFGDSVSESWERGGESCPNWK